MPDELPAWFVRLIDDRFDAIEKRQSEHALDMQRRQDDIERETHRRLGGIEDSQTHLDECLDEMKNAIANDQLQRAKERAIEAEVRKREGELKAAAEAKREQRITHLERILFGAAGILLAAALLQLGEGLRGKSYETPRVYEYPTTPYKGGPR